MFHPFFVSLRMNPRSQAAPQHKTSFLHLVCADFALEMSAKWTNNGDIRRKIQYEATEIKKIELILQKITAHIVCIC
jgi:hypothetical protein